MSYIFTQEELEKLCKEWQVILGLSDWTIKVEIARNNQLFKEGTQGGIKWTLGSKTAWMKLLDPIDFEAVTDSPFWPQDMEETLVHELVHLYISPLNKSEDNSIEDILFEQAVEALSKALIKVKRKNI